MWTGRRRGYLIVLEGIDGTGKSTLARGLRDHLVAQGIPVVLSREPTDGPNGRRLRESATRGRLPLAEELALFMADRREHVAGVVGPALEAGKVVVLDRYYPSTAAYQGARGADWREILRANAEFAPEPDLVLLLELPLDEAVKRIGERGGGTDEYERREYLEKVRNIFAAMDFRGLARLDARQPAEGVLASAVGVVEEAWGRSGWRVAGGGAGRC